MTNKEMAKTIAATCKAAMKRNQFRYVDIEINYGLPYISVGMNGTTFYAQGQDADEFIEQAKEASKKFNLAITTCLIWQLDSAGVL